MICFANQYYFIEILRVGGDQGVVIEVVVEGEGEGLSVELCEDEDR